MYMTCNIPCCVYLHECHYKSQQRYHRIPRASLHIPAPFRSPCLPLHEPDKPRMEYSGGRHAHKPRPGNQHHLQLRRGHDDGGERRRAEDGGGRHAVLGGQRRVPGMGLDTHSAMHVWVCFSALTPFAGIVWEVLYPCFLSDRLSILPFELSVLLLPSPCLFLLYSANLFFSSPFIFSLPVHPCTNISTYFSESYCLAFCKPISACYPIHLLTVACPDGFTEAPRGGVCYHFSTDVAEFGYASALVR